MMISPRAPSKQISRFTHIHKPARHDIRSGNKFSRLGRYRYHNNKQSVLAEQKLPVPQYDVPNIARRPDPSMITLPDDTVSANRENFLPISITRPISGIKVFFFLIPTLSASDAC